MAAKKIDKLDRKILSLITENARVPFLEVARECNVSGAAIHQRVQRLMNIGVVSGSQFNLNPKGLEYNTCAFIGIQVNFSGVNIHEEIIHKIKAIPEVVECHHVSGKFYLLAKLYTKSNEHLKKTIIEGIQAIPEVTKTETFISLEEGFIRQIPVD